MSSIPVAPTAPTGREPGAPGPAPGQAADAGSTSGAPAGQCLAAGARIGEYHVLRVLHTDDAGVAYLARDLLLQRDTVVLEHLPVALAHRNGSGQVVLRAAGDAMAFLASQKAFIERAQRQARFDHPSSAPLWRCWYGNGTAYAAMPYHGGVTLADARRAMSHPPEESWLRTVALPLLDAIESLHALPALHLGIAPERVALRADGRAMLLNPGSQPAAGGGAGAAYQPPEQREPADHLPLGAWTDLYALAATLYHAITGHAPPPGTPAAAGAIATPGPLARALTAIRAQWPRMNYSAGLIRAIDQSLAASPGDRPQSVAQFRRALNPIEPTTSARPIADDPAYLSPPASQSFPAGNRPLARMPSVPAAGLPVLTDTSNHKTDKAPQWIGPNNAAIAADIERTLGMVAAHAARDAANLRGAVAGERRPLKQPARRRLLGPALLAAVGGLIAAGAYLWQDEGEPGQSLRQAIGAVHAKVTALRESYDPLGWPAPLTSRPVPASPDGVGQSAPIDAHSPAPAGAQPPVDEAPPPARVEAEASPQSRSSAMRGLDGPSTDTAPPAGTAKASAQFESPRAACGARSNFSLLYCMEQQCQLGQFVNHPQCVRLRATGEVE